MVSLRYAKGGERPKTIQHLFVRALTLSLPYRSCLSRSFRSQAARIIAQLLVSGGTLLFRSAAQAYRQAIINGKKAGVHEGTAQAFRSKKMDLVEAYNILGVNDSTPWPEIVKVSLSSRR